jgi:hypothetical protein
MAQGTNDVAKGRKELLNQQFLKGWHDAKQTTNNGKKWKSDVCDEECSHFFGSVPV